MSKTTSDKEKYYRAGIAIPIERKAILEERLKTLGMTTIGDLITFFVLAPNLDEVLKPHAIEFKEIMKERKVRINTRGDLINQIKQMTPEELEKLIELSKASLQLQQDAV